MWIQLFLLGVISYHHGIVSYRIVMVTELMYHMSYIISYHILMVSYLIVLSWYHHVSYLIVSAWYHIISYHRAIISYLSLCVPWQLCLYIRIYCFVVLTFFNYSIVLFVIIHFCLQYVISFIIMCYRCHSTCCHVSLCVSEIRSFVELLLWLLISGRVVVLSRSHPAVFSWCIFHSVLSH